MSTWLFILGGLSGFALGLACMGCGYLIGTAVTTERLRRARVLGALQAARERHPTA